MPGDGASNATVRIILISYVRVYTNAQDLTGQRNALLAPLIVWKTHLLRCGPAARVLRTAAANPDCFLPGTKS